MVDQDFNSFEFLDFIAFLRGVKTQNIRESRTAAGSYTDTHPAVFAGEQDQPSGYPVPLEAGAPSGRDPLFKELQEAYRTPYIYGMHWIIDVDNWYGFGNRGDGKSHGSLMNTFQRGRMSCRTIRKSAHCFDRQTDS